MKKRQTHQLLVVDSRAMSVILEEMDCSTVSFHKLMENVTVVVPMAIYSDVLSQACYRNDTGARLASRGRAKHAALMAGLYGNSIPRPNFEKPAFFVSEYPYGNGWIMRFIFLPEATTPYEARIMGKMWMGAIKDYICRQEKIKLESLDVKVNIAADIRCNKRGEYSVEYY